MAEFLAAGHELKLMAFSDTLLEPYFPMSTSLYSFSQIRKLSQCHLRKTEGKEQCVPPFQNLHLVGS